MIVHAFRTSLALFMNVMCHIYLLEQAGSLPSDCKVYDYCGSRRLRKRVTCRCSGLSEPAYFLLEKFSAKPLVNFFRF